MKTEKSPFGKYHTLSQSETMNGKIGVTIMSMPASYD